MRYTKYGMQTAADHIFAAHSFKTAAKNSSKFLAQYTKQDILNLVKIGIKQGKPTPSGFVHTFDKVIGTNAEGNATKTLYIFVKKNGLLRTAFPK
ncbi:MAG: hypothetical protein KDD52_09385 [Bdellovibrionales bacterium]|nr:hypothetical protein [Bdellovibrionales bacterium]